MKKITRYDDILEEFDKPSPRFKPDNKLVELERRISRLEASLKRLQKRIENK